MIAAFPPTIRIRRGALGALFCLCLVSGCRESSAARGGGWGIDACLTAHVDSQARAAYLPQLRAARVTIVRERGPNPTMTELETAGFRVDSFLSLGSLPIEQRGNALPEDLLAVFSAAKAMQHQHGRYVDAWEMVGEPDVGYCRDLPDRVAAFQKAVYLGIKFESGEARKRESEDGGQKAEARSQRELAGAAHTPLVLMGALALPPGPWLERAARNGLLDYTDAYNFHFYGFANDLSGVIRAHKAFATKWVDLRRRAMVELGVTRAGGESDPWVLVPDPPLLSRFSSSGLPIWITECGLNAVEPGDFLNAQRRQLQADFTVATARRARAAESVAVFMPFILVHEGDPHALTLAPDRPLPAWEAYASYCRRHLFPSRTLAMPLRDPNPVVVQWMPDNRTAIPHKVSGTYRFWQGQPIRGVLRIYNFGQEPVRGTFEADALRHIRLECPDFHSLAQSRSEDSRLPAFRSSARTIPPFGRWEIPVTFTPDVPGYFRDFWEAAFLDERGRRSPVYFGLEAMPDEDDLVPVPIERGPPGRGRINHSGLDGDAVTSESGAWAGINGLLVETDESRRRINFQNPEAEANGDALVLRMSVTTLNNDPLQPTMAIARVRGLPPRGFLRLQLDRPMEAGLKVRMDLIDRLGQRFTIWENLGASYFGRSDDVWLNLADFHIYFWGRCSEHPDFRPQDIEEIRLRCNFTRANDPRMIQLSCWQMPGDPQ